MTKKHVLSLKRNGMHFQTTKPKSFLPAPLTKDGMSTLLTFQKEDLSLPHSMLIRLKVQN